MMMSDIVDRSAWASYDSEYPKITIRCKRCKAKTFYTEGLPSSSVDFIDAHRTMNNKCVCVVVMR
tara:strand:- start:57 stop:251 length:195 start_codon:yes stop_codon:yes gene_type:complete